MSKKKFQKIRDKFPLLEELEREDIKFECVPRSVQLDMAKSIDPSYCGWQVVGEKMNISTRDLKYIAQLKEHPSNTLNMFEFYSSEQGDNSLRLFCDGLVELGLQDVLHQLSLGWEKVKKEHRNSRNHQKKCAVQNECYNSCEKCARMQTCSFHCPQQLIPSYPPNLHCDRPGCMCQQVLSQPGVPMPSWQHGPPAEVQHSRDKLNYTRCWVESLPSGQPHTPGRGREPGHFNSTKDKTKMAATKPHKERTLTGNATRDMELKDIKREPSDTRLASVQTDSSGHQSINTSGSLPSFGSSNSSPGPHRGLPGAKQMGDGIYFRKGSPLNGVRPQHEHLPSIQAAFFPQAAPVHTAPQVSMSHYVHPSHPPGVRPHENFNPFAPVNYGNVFQQAEPMDTEEPPANGEVHISATSGLPEKVKEKSLSQDVELETRNHSDNISFGAKALNLVGPEGKRRMTIPMRRPDEIRILEGREPSSPESSLDSLRRSLSSRGRIESNSFIDSLRNVSVFVTHLYNHWEHHPMEKQYSKCAVSLGRCLKENNFRIQMDVPNVGRVPKDESSWREWIDRKFQHANYVLVCLSPTYLEVVNASHIEDTEDIVDNIQSTRYIFHLMQHEFEENQAVNKRFLPILFSDIPCSDFPHFLQRSPAYRWTRDFEDLFWRLTQPDQTVSNILANQQG